MTNLSPAILIDYDIVNSKNLNRQFLINKKDDGKKKSSSVKKNLEKRFLLDIIIYDCKIKEETDLKHILSLKCLKILNCFIYLRHRKTVTQ